MDVIRSSATFLILRLRLACSEIQAIQTFCELCDIDDRHQTIEILQAKLKQIHHTPLEESTVNQGYAVPELTPTDIQIIFGQKKLLAFAHTLEADVQKVREALCELLPALINRFYALELDSQNSQ